MLVSVTLSFVRNLFQRLFTSPLFNPQREPLSIFSPLYQGVPSHQCIVQISLRFDLYSPDISCLSQDAWWNASGVLATFQLCHRYLLIEK